MKYLLAVFLIIAFSDLSIAQERGIKKDTTAINTPYNVDDERHPEYPNGQKAFQNYIAKNLKYPAVARLIGIDGQVVISFTIDENGKVINVYPVNCIGAGCESEAVKVIEGSKKWQPGSYHGQPVKVQYSVPIGFFNPKDEVTFRELRNSDYGFVFNIKDSLYTIDEAQKILGKSFPSKNIDIAEPFYNYNNIQKFNIPDKKEVYLLIFKST
jgi:TonB family protein